LFARHNDSKYVESRNYTPFGGPHDGRVHLGVIPKTAK